MGTILVVFVGLALALFISEGLLSSGRSLFSNPNELAKINGESISIQDFEQRVQQLSDNYKAANKTDAVDARATEQFREQVWGQLMNELIFGKEYEKLDITVSPQELFDMVQGRNVHPQIRQAFTDPKTGMFNPANVVRFLKNMDNVDAATRNQWFNLEKGIKEERIAQKYNNLLTQSFYITTSEARMSYIDQARTASIKFVMAPYTSVQDKDIKVSEEDLEAYYKAHQQDYYQQESTRSMDYVTLEVLPSNEDRMQVEQDMQKLFEEFKTAKDFKEDSAFVKRNADTKSEVIFYKKGDLPPSLDTLMFKENAGFIKAPYIDGDVYRMAKLLEVKSLPDSVKARHILLQIATPADKDKVMARADSMKKAIKAGAKFEDLAKKYSVDKGSAEKGGDLGWFASGTMVKQFNDACFEGKKGDMPIVQSQFGVHLIEILDQKNPSKRVKVAMVDRRLEPSNKTYQSYYAKANDFASAIVGADFDKVAAAKGLNKRSAQVRENDRSLSGIESTREVIRWAFKASEGELSKVFESGDRYIVAKLTEIREKGTLPLKYVKQAVDASVRREKKAEVLIEKLKGVNSIDVAATKVQASVQEAPEVSFATSAIGTVGREPEVTGNIFALKAGQLSAPLKGNMGVYMVQVVSFKEPEVPKDFKQAKNMLAMNMKQRASYEIYKVLKEKASVKDNRIRFY